MDEFQELEYKFKADNVKLTDFLKLIESLKPIKRLDVASWDHYYTSESEDFIRFRNSSTPELTIKRKTKGTNNWNRTEIDLPLDFHKINEKTVSKFVELLGYKENFKIYKNCFVFWLDNCNYVWYTVYNSDMEELGRFIEVEINKEKVDYLRNYHYDDRNNTGPKDGAIEYLNEAAKELEKLGLSPQNRMKKSLFELFKK